MSWGRGKWGIFIQILAQKLVENGEGWILSSGYEKDKGLNKI